MRAAHDLEGSTRLASTLEHLSDIDIASPAVYEAGIPHEIPTQGKVAVKLFRLYAL